MDNLQTEVLHMEFGEFSKENLQDCTLKDNFLDLQRHLQIASSVRNDLAVSALSAYLEKN